MPIVWGINTKCKTKYFSVTVPLVYTIQVLRYLFSPPSTLSPPNTHTHLLLLENKWVHLKWAYESVFLCCCYCRLKCYWKEKDYWWICCSAFVKMGICLSVNSLKLLPHNVVVIVSLFVITEYVHTYIHKYKYRITFKWFGKSVNLGFILKKNSVIQIPAFESNFKTNWKNVITRIQ